MLMLCKTQSRKGQFFIIFTSILFFMIVTIVIIRYSYMTVKPPDEIPHYIFLNLQDDIEDVVNIIMSINQTSEQVETTMHEYMCFLSNFSEYHSLDFRSYYFIGLAKGSELNITVGNFYNTPLRNINITVTDDTPSTTQQNITILTTENETTVSFADAFNTYNTVQINITHDNLAVPVVFNMTSNSVFEVFFLELGRDRDLWVKRIVN